MKFLMITRKVNKDDASPAGFAYDWVKRIGGKVEKLFVIAWQTSERDDLPSNIEIISLPNNKLAKIIVLQNQLLRILPQVDGVFCHQNPEYAILAGPLLKIYRKKLISWYTHKAVNWKLRLVNFFSNKILTASTESCRLRDRSKIIVTGHGIDIEKFKVQSSNLKIKIQNSKFKIISVGRISPVKNYETLIGAIEILIQKNINNLKVEIIGEPVLKSDQQYLKRLKEIIKEKNLNNYIEFLGGVGHNQILPYYQRADLFVNLSATGSVDKAVLEAMACGKLVLTSNEAFINILKNERLCFSEKDPVDLAQKIIGLTNLSPADKEIITARLRQEIVQNHNLDNLVGKIINSFYE